MKGLLIFLTLSAVLIMGCSGPPANDALNDEPAAPHEAYEIPEPSYDSPEGMYIPPTPVGFSFDSRSNCDSLTEAERIHIDSSATEKVKVWETDSIHIRYLAVGNYCGFFEGNYRYENDTVFVWDREDAYDGCGENCLFVLDYVVPKPNKSYTLWVNGTVVQ